MPLNCLMPHCRHRRDTYHCTLHQFPHQEPSRSEWIKACRRFHKLADGTVIPWAGPGAQAAVCSCHFSKPYVVHRGRRSSKSPQLKCGVPDINLPERDYIVFRGFRSGDKRKKQTENESDNESEDEDDRNSGRSSSRATPYDDAILTAMEIPNVEVVSSDAIPPSQGLNTDVEPLPKKARKSGKATARKSTSKSESYRTNEEEPFFSHEFLEDLASCNAPYVPPDPPLELGLEVSHHACNACGSEFVLESSLRNHLSRNVLEITYVCRVCPQILIFNNRCTFLNHCLMHEPLADRDQLCRRAVVRMAKSLPNAKDLDVSMDPYQSPVCSPVGTSSGESLDPAPGPATVQRSLSNTSTTKTDALDSCEPMNGSDFGQKGGLSATTPLAQAPVGTNSVPELTGDVPVQQISGASNIESPHRGIDDELLEEYGKDDDDMYTVDDTAIECPECKLSFIGHHGMVAHFGSHKRPMSKLVCPLCRMVLSSRCCYKSHVRAHTGEKPCVCFICATVIETSVFQRHLNEKCLAYCRRLVTDCSVCMKTMKTLKDYLEHLESEHIEFLYKCTLCTMAFTTDAGCRTHQSTEHSATALGGTKIMKCSLCVALFQSKALLDQHMEKTHINSIITQGTFQFVCQICPDRCCYTLKKDLFTHYRQRHPEKYRPYLCNECDFDGQAAPKLALHIYEAHSGHRSVESVEREKEPPPPNKCPICQHDCQDTPEIYAHRAEHETFDARYWCFVCREIFPSKQALVQHERICTRYTDENGDLIAHLCEVCSETFLEKEELTAHVAEHHHVTKFPCGLCGLTYSSEEDLATHTEEQHSREKRKLPFVCQVCEKRNIEKAFSKVTWLKRHIAVVHRNKSGQIIPDEPAETIEVKVKSPEVKHLKRDGENTYTCAKCNFQTDERKVFRDHIDNHKSSDGVQCPDCGLNFVVLSSLRKHLLMVHRIRDIETHMSEISSGTESVNNPKNGFKLDEDSLNCCVCSKHFEDLSTLKVHMRSHGMAYINMKRNGAAPVKQ